MNNNIALSDNTQQLSQTLILKFFLNFSRFEYALKASGYFIPRNRTGRQDAEPDWGRFRKAMENVFKIDINKELQKACQYILANPPKKQVVVNASVVWKAQKKAKNRSDVEFLLQMVKCVRNNLFHGGKHNNDNTKRTKLLLNAVLLILDECLNREFDVKRKYDQAII